MFEQPDNLGPVDPAIAKQAVTQLEGTAIGQQSVAQSGASEIGQQPVGQTAITRHLPDALKSSLPSIEEIEAELGDAHA